MGLAAFTLGTQIILELLVIAQTAKVKQLMQTSSFSEQLGSSGGS
ncbi:hypothetical protein Cylst_1254 [Cylindrospermum stagnale PCC 7417]|uniref:Uncharacterized protein n=1 Tax=Cylindrospermum stagnale PCC 7417 TaxID=56107 RepID=K9WUS0_9NOST|nr:hypothetical protein Cylst_1254 [Cylindrospermum stagnale PCC 7417]